MITGVLLISNPAPTFSGSDMRTPRLYSFPAMYRRGAPTSSTEPTPVSNGWQALHPAPLLNGPPVTIEIAPLLEAKTSGSDLASPGWIYAFRKSRSPKHEMRNKHQQENTRYAATGPGLRHSGFPLSELFRFSYFVFRIFCLRMINRTCAPE